ncbi:MAG TPA: hypothetical protein VMH00_04095 [Candidatus Limnocylindrales bacterium]|nr:hypothetical protein [Candidatus Limnocylindrales bacterium]
MPKLLGIVGTLVICAGLDLLWQCRHEIRFWIAAYLKVFRAMLRQEEPERVFPAKEAAEKRQGAVRFLLGMGLTFFLGPILIVLGLTLMFYTNL